MTAYITSQMADNNIPGLSIALVDDQIVVWATGFGSADREGRVDADADTVYHIGSCSKAFLGTAYMQLRNQGRVNLEASLTNYMPEFSMLPRFTNSGPVIIRSLLNHQSGLPGDFFNGSGTISLPYYDLTEWLIFILQNDYRFPVIMTGTARPTSWFIRPPADYGSVRFRVRGMPRPGWRELPERRLHRAPAITTRTARPIRPYMITKRESSMSCCPDRVIRRSV